MAAHNRVLHAIIDSFGALLASILICRAEAAPAKALSSQSNR
jgi:hypothetical protein